MSGVTSVSVAWNLKEPKGDPFTVYGYTSRRAVRKYIKRLLSLQTGRDRAATLRYGTLAAVQTLALSSGSGAVGGTINGVTVTDTWATSDTISAGLIAAAINASTDALVQYHVQASNLAATITLATCLAQGFIEICGYRLRPVGKVGAAPNTLAPGTFDVTGSDTADAQALVAAIKAMPGLQDLVWAANSSGVVTVSARGPAATLPVNQLLKSGTSGVTVSGGALAATANVVVSALVKGLPGNTITLAASGTGVTAGGARLAGGTSSSVALP